MQFAVILLVILMAACVAGSFISQGKSYDWYSRMYSERAAAAIIALGLNDVFHSAWFILIAAFLSLNLMMCNLIRLPALIRRWKKSAEAESVLSEKSAAEAAVPELKDQYFHSLGFRDIKSGEADGRAVRFSAKNRAGLFGAWICHLGVLLLILGFGLGQSLKEEYVVYGVPGQSKMIGNTNYVLTIDDFRTDLREDGSVAQYEADVTVRNISDGSSTSGTAGVNEPASAFGMKIYQNSTGWASAIHIRKNGTALQDEVLCAGDFTAVSDKPDLVIYLNAFYPDYSNTGGAPVSLSQELRNPAWLYSVYYQGQILGMNALKTGEELTIDEYTVTFTDPQTYTLLQIKRDPFIPLALAGGLITMLGIILALFVQPASMWAKEEADGTWRIGVASRKGGMLLSDHFHEVVGEDRLPE